jgi:hypothetical protein
MKRERLFCLVGVVAALHVAVLSMVFGLRHAGYMLAATLSATVIWGTVLLLKEGKCRATFIGGVLLGLTVQQVVYQVWKADLPGFWWPLGQFAALYFLVAWLIGRAAP